MYRLRYPLLGALLLFMLVIASCHTVLADSESEGEYHQECEASVRAHATVEERGSYSPYGPEIELIVKDSSGRIKRRWSGWSHIPIAVILGPGHSVSLELKGGDPSLDEIDVSSQAKVTYNCPRDTDVVEVYAVVSAESSESSGGKYKARAWVDLHRYYPSLVSIKLKVSYSLKYSYGRSDRGEKEVYVHLSPEASTTQSQTSTSTTSTSTSTSLTIVMAGSLTPTSSTTSSPQVFATSISRTSSTTQSQASGTSHSSRPVQSTGSTAEGPTETGRSASTHHPATIDPASQVVDAGQIARFNVYSSLSSPKFELRNLPTGYRYLISREGDHYLLRIFTHPLSYGTFDMTLVIRDGKEEESLPFSLTVRRATTTGQASSTAYTTPVVSGTRETAQPETTTTWTQEGKQVTTVITIVKEERSPVEPLALGGVVATLLALLALLLKRRG